MSEARSDGRVTYSSYLKLDELLALQQPLSDGPEHDETLFIVIHQVYELWFKQILHELDYLKRLLERGDDVPRALHTLKRMLTILKVVVAQIDVLETMTPLEFLSFRDAARVGQRLPVVPVPRARVRARREEPGGARPLSAGQRARATARAPPRGADAVGRVPPLPAAAGHPVPARSARARRHAAGRAGRRRSTRS